MFVPWNDLHNTRREIRSLLLPTSVFLKSWTIPPFSTAAKFQVAKKRRKQMNFSGSAGINDGTFWPEPWLGRAVESRAWSGECQTPEPGMSSCGRVVLLDISQFCSINISPPLGTLCQASCYYVINVLQMHF